MNRKQRRAKLRAARAHHQRQREARTQAARREPEATTIEGEDPWAIFDALVQMRQGTGGDGLVTFDLELPSEEMAPVRRAHMRIQAELLLEDAASWSGPDIDARTDDQRSFDAFELLVHRTCAAIGACLARREMIYNSYEL